MFHCPTLIVDEIRAQGGVGRRSRVCQVGGDSGEVMEPGQRGVRPWQGAGEMGWLKLCSRGDRQR